jgi:hypothetical protein
MPDLKAKINFITNKELGEWHCEVVGVDANYFDSLVPKEYQYHLKPDYGSFFAWPKFTLKFIERKSSLVGEIHNFKPIIEKLDPFYWVSEKLKGVIITVLDSNGDPLSSMKLIGLIMSKPKFEENTITLDFNSDAYMNL